MEIQHGDVLVTTDKIYKNPNVKSPRFRVEILSKMLTTVNFLNIRTPKKIVVITLKFELCGSTTE